MVSACAYSGAYPTGYGRYQLNTEGVPTELYDRQLASGFTHFQQSGHRRDPQVLQLLPGHADAGAAGRPRQLWDLLDERAEPGYYAAPSSSGIRCELTVGPHSAVHRYTFPAHRDARMVIDFSLGGLAIPYGATVPLRAHLESIGPGSRRARSSSRARRWPSTWSATPRLAAAALVRPAADARRHPAGLRPDPADDAAAVRADVARAHRPGPGGRAAVRLLAARRRPGPGEPAGRLRPADPRRRRPAQPGGRLADRGPHPAGVGGGRVREPAAADRGGLAGAPGHDPGRHGVDGPEDGLRDRALPLADQALPGHRGEPVLADRRAVRVRHLHDVGHLPDPAAAADRPVPRPGRRAGQRAAEHLRGGGEPPDRLPDGQGRRPVLPAGQRARATPSSPTCASSGVRHRLGLGARATCTTTCAARTARSSCSAA